LSEWKIRQDLFPDFKWLISQPGRDPFTVKPSRINTVCTSSTGNHMCKSCPLEFYMQRLTQQPTGSLHVGKGVLFVDMETQAMQQSPLNPSKIIIKPKQ